MSAVLRPSPEPRVPSPGVMLAWCASVFLIAGALLPLVPRIGAGAAPVVLEVAGDLRRVHADEVRAAVEARLHDDFYRLDLEAVRAAVEAMPWVAVARVTRVWPGTVRVDVQEHVPYARWGERALLSQSGAVFTPLARDVPADLPRLAGPEGQQHAVRAAFEQLQAQLGDTPFAPVGLAVDRRGEWTAITADGIELKLGRGSPLEAVARLAGPVRAALEERLQEVAYVDLHYINGFAVGWRDGRAGDAAVAGAGPPGGND